MRTFADVPIKQKLMMVTTVTTAVALLIAGIGIVASDAFLFRRYLERDLAALAHVVADNSTAALAFNDPQVASETLAALRAKAHVVSACVYRADGTILARYARPDAAGGGCPSVNEDEAPRFIEEGLTLSRPILLSGRRLGSLTLLYDLAEISQRIVLYSATVLGVLLFSSLIALWISSRMRSAIVRPISQLVRASRRVSDTNDYTVRAEKVSGDELGRLVDHFNEMLAAIQSRDDHLRTVLHDRELALQDAESARERFRFLAESMPQKIFTARPTGDIDYLNQQWFEFTGLSSTQIPGWGWTEVVHPDDVEGNLREWQRSILSGDLFTFEQRFRRADGQYRWHLSRALAMRDGEGKISMWIGSNTDIHEQKLKEEELRRANDDLQQFAYSASHDLQEPIRNVAVYSELIAARYHDILDSEGRQFLGFLSEGGRRLATLISDLLAYTRAGMAEENVVKLDATAVLRQTLASLAEAIRESDAVITFGDLPEVDMGATHLQQVFLNLIGNALKYRKDRPEIHISAAGTGAAWCFTVKDNGIGIDPQYKEKIFGVFKRLHRDQKYSGTGIGLAICQRVLESYGGKIWVESALGKGATFFFTIPQRAPRVAAPAVKSVAG